MNHGTKRFSELTAYLWATPNSRRVAILLEELDLDYRAVAVNIRAGEQFAAELVALNPYGKIPVVHWLEDGRREVLFESGAILLRLAELAGALLPRDGADRHDVLSWLMMAVSGLSPASGQAHHWTALAPERPAVAAEHAVASAARAYRALDTRLQGREYLARRYSIADIAAYPWIERHGWTTLSLGDYPALAAWFARVGRRDAVQRGMQVPRGITLD